MAKLTPMFAPTNNQYGAPRVFLAAVGPHMTEVAGEVCDGVIVHAFTTEKYLRETTLPALTRGMAKSGRRRQDFEISYPVFVVTNGQKGMPPFGSMMSDEQIAAVVNYIRTNLGNEYADAVSAADVKAFRK